VVLPIPLRGQCRGPASAHCMVVRRHPHFMKYRTPLITAALIVSVFTGCSKPHATSPKPQPITFVGYTNGVVGEIAPVFAKGTDDSSAAINGWLAAGTNGAVFIITNRQDCPIDLFPIGRMRSRGEHPMNEETPLLNAPTFSGIRLQPGQVATVQVAVLPHQGSWYFQINCTRTDSRKSFSIESDMIDK